jgi:Tol biopolymer transport system component
MRHNTNALNGTSPDGKSSVWIINADGTNARPLVLSGVSDHVTYPSWYPDGEHLAVLDADENVIKRIDRKGGSAVRLTDPQQVLTGMPSVSPDGNWIAFAGQKNVGQTYDQTKNSIWLLSATGELRTAEPSPRQGRTPAWSADDQWLTFESTRGSLNSRYSVFIMRRDGTSLRQITAYELDANHPVWSPDGGRLVFSARHPAHPNTTGIAITDVSGTR